MQRAEEANPLYSLLRHKFRADRAWALQERFMRTGITDDIDQSIAITSELVKAIPEFDPARFIYLRHHSGLLYQRYKQIGSTDDLHQSISNAEAATKLSSQSSLPYLGNLESEHRTSANNLSLALLSRFQRMGYSEDLDNAIQLAQQSQRSSDGTSGSLILTEAFINYFEKTNTISYLNEAISICQLVQLFLDRSRAHRYFVESSMLLAAALLKRYNTIHSLNDINLAIDAMNSVISSESNDHPNRANHLDIIGNCFDARFLRTGIINDLHSTIKAKEEAFSLPTASPIIRLNTAQLLPTKS